MRLLVIRGDLQSHSGHAASARDFCRVLQGMFDQTVGVDIHYSTHLPFEPFPCPVISDEDARRLAARADFALVITYTTPDFYVRYPNAACVGLAVWETDRLPDRPSWIERVNRMDGLWVESTHTKTMFEEAGVRTPIRVIPWPIQSAPTHAPGFPEGQAFDMDRTPPLARLLVHGARLEGKRPLRIGLPHQVGLAAARLFLHRLRVSSRELVRSADRTLVCVAQDVPRKGLLLLLSEWMEFKRRPEAAPWRLLFRSYPPREVRPFDFVARFWSYVQALKRQLGVESAGVTLWSDGLNDREFEQLVARSAGCICASLGEGFCGPAALALRLGKPLLAPRHTSFLDLLPADYPYTFATRPAHIRFPHSPSAPIYHPASIWQVPEPFALADGLTRLVTDPLDRRAEAVAKARAHCLEFCDPRRVLDSLEEEFARLAARQMTGRLERKPCPVA